MALEALSSSTERACLQVCAFVTTYQLLHEGNRIAVLASGDGVVINLFSDLTLAPRTVDGIASTSTAEVIARGLKDIALGAS
jgi:hypothetical protein